VSLARTLRTVRHLKPRQLVAQVWHTLGPVSQPVAMAPEGAAWAIDGLAASPLPPPDHARWDGAGRIELIHRAVDFGSAAAIDFAHAVDGPLWAYQLHFFEWARSADATPEARAAAVARWLDSVPQVAGGPAWDPHPVSVRALSWLKLRFAGGLPADFAGSAADGRLRSSLASQIDWLSRNVETRLQANHLLENWIAVVAGGVALDAPRARHWRAGVEPLVVELDAQIGPDGAHCERSPMYHAVLLEHLLDLLSLVRVAAGRVPGGFEDRLVDVCARMLGALEVWTHPDGEIALVGDSAFGIGQSPAALRAYAEALGIAAVGPAGQGVLASVGAVRLADDSFSWLGSFAGPSPQHQPGHAHCDALAFELCVEGQRVVTDTGVFEYVAGDRRTQARTTRSHATLELAGEEQSEIWSAHRVGGRAMVELSEVEPGRSVSGSCRGWATPQALHRRSVELEAGGLTIHDRLEGAALPVRAHLPLAPGLEPELAGAELWIPLASGRRLRVELPALDWRLERAPYYPRFGVEESRCVVIGEAPRFESGRWRFWLEEPKP